MIEDVDVESTNSVSDGEVSGKASSKIGNVHTEKTNERGVGWKPITFQFHVVLTKEDTR